MRATDAIGIDLIKEFRLRNWARQNYVRPEQRGKSWHPVVLEEMRFRDEELRAEQSEIGSFHSAFVPLAPTETFYLDEAHAVVPPPKSLSLRSGSDISAHAACLSE